MFIMHFKVEYISKVRQNTAAAGFAAMFKFMQDFLKAKQAPHLDVNLTSHGGPFYTLSENPGLRVSARIVDGQPTG